MPDDNAIRQTEIERLAAYPPNPLLTKIHQKIGTFNIVKNVNGVEVSDSSLDQIQPLTPPDPTQELQQTDENFLGEFNAGVQGTR